MDYSKLSREDYNRVLEISKEINEIRNRNNLYSLEIKDEIQKLNHYDFKAVWDSSTIVTRSGHGPIGFKMVTVNRNIKTNGDLSNYEPSYDEYINKV